MTTRRFVLALFPIVVFVTAASAAEIQVAAGEDTVSKAVAKASAGDVIRLGEGEFRGDCAVGKNIRIVGSGVDKTRWVAATAAISVADATVTISDITFQGREGTLAGIMAESPVRVERCRFVRLNHAVSLRGAPLSDVVACEFTDCDIGVRAISGASPTVWSCVFRQGRQGVFCMDGGAFLQHCLFEQLEEGVRLLSAKQPTVRNCVFDRVKQAGVVIMNRGELALLAPSVRNNVFVRCTAVRGPADWLVNVSHNAAEEPPDKPLLVEPGELADADKRVQTLRIGYSLGDDGIIRFKNAEPLSRAGCRFGSEPEKTIAAMGPIAPWGRPGCVLPASATLPPVRFEGPTFIANAVGEEYLALAFWRCTSKRQHVIIAEGGKRMDVHDVDCEQGGGERCFNIDRFFGETALSP